MAKGFEKICKKSQADVKKYVERRLKETHELIISEDGFVYAQGSFPVLLVAHMDTVHDVLPYLINHKKDEKGNDIISSPMGIGGDDRCGIYMIFQVLKRFNCSVLFCEDEEIGTVGAKKFTKHPVSKDLKFNYIIEFDRKGSNDAVFYDCDNPEFTDFITKEFFKEAYGSFSDISVVAPHLGCAAVNLSCGYYNAHKKDEYVVIQEMEAVIEEACKILERTTEDDVYEYIEAVYNYKNSKWWDYGGYNYYKGCYTTSDIYGYEDEIIADTKYEVEEMYFLISYYNVYGEIVECEVFAHSDVEAVGQFLINHPDICYNSIIGIMADEFYM